MTNEIKSVFVAINYRTGAETEVIEDGAGQEAVTKAMSKFPRHTKFVLDGFEIDGYFVPLYFKNR
jgi:hypothetical protein